MSVHATSIAGGTQRDPEGTSREPRRRCYGHRRGISLPKAPYQNAARMSRGAEGTTEASGRRDQAGLAARKRRVGAVRGAVPAQNEPKSDRPRAKTPINRRKSRLRRRAAPISIPVSLLRTRAIRRLVVRVSSDRASPLPRRSASFEIRSGTSERQLTRALVDDYKRQDVVTSTGSPSRLRSPIEGLMIVPRSVSMPTVSAVGKCLSGPVSAPPVYCRRPLRNPPRSTSTRKSTFEFTAPT